MWMTNVKVVLVVLVTLGLYTWVANSIPQLESEVPEELSFTGAVSEADLVTAGEELYAGGGQCVSCHGLGTRAPNLLTDEGGTGTIGQRCAERVPGEDCKTYLYHSITDPNAYLVQGYTPSMPPQGRILSQNQIWALVAYLQSLGGEVTVTAADLEAAPAEGAAPSQTAAAAGGPTSSTSDPVQLMRDNLCFACHVLGGEGVQVGPPLDGIGARMDVATIRRSILDPGAEAAAGFEALLGVMPANLADMLTARQLEILVQFLADRR